VVERLELPGAPCFWRLLGSDAGADDDMEAADT